jgi:hypothetical protein
MGLADSNPAARRCDEWAQRLTGARRFRGGAVSTHREALRLPPVARAGIAAPASRAETQAAARPRTDRSARNGRTPGVSATRAAYARFCQGERQHAAARTRRVDIVLSERVKHELVTLACARNRNAGAEATTPLSGRPSSTSNRRSSRAWSGKGELGVESRESASVYRGWARQTLAGQRERLPGLRQLWGGGWRSSVGWESSDDRVVRFGCGWSTPVGGDPCRLPRGDPRIEDLAL